MMTKIKFIILIALAIWPQVMFAAKAVPKSAPLQPIPAGIAPNVHDNVNTPGNDFNQNQIEEYNQINSAETPPQSEGTASPTTSVLPQSAEMSYWLYLIFGILGLIGLGVWLYFVLRRHRIKNEIK